MMRITTTAIFLTLVLGTALLSSERAQAVRAQTLLEQLRSGDRLAVVRILNEIKKEGSRGDVVFIIRDIWNGNKLKYPDLNWELLETDYVRLNMADVLVQASQHGTIELDKQPLRDFVLNSVNSKDELVVSLAVSILGFMGSENDLEIILEVARRFDEGPFRVAVVELFLMCGERAGKALDELEEQIVREDRILFLNYLRETKSRLQDYKENVRCRY